MNLLLHNNVKVEHQAKRLFHKLEEIDNVFHNQLILLVGPSKSGKTSILREINNYNANKYIYINLGLSLSKMLLELTIQERRSNLMKILLNFISKQKEENMLIDNMEILFDSQLYINPMKCLITLSKLKKMTVVSWSGLYEPSQGILTYGEINHPEYQSHKIKETGAEVYLVNG